MPACRSCGSEILWAITVNGKPIPIDREPSADGNVRITMDTSGRRQALVLGPLDVELYPEGEPLYLSHFVTCPQSDEWRDGK